MQRSLVTVLLVVLCTLPAGGVFAQAHVGPPARVRVTADSAGVGLSLVRGTYETSVFVGGHSGYAVSHLVEDLCEAPCELELPSGRYRFHVSRRGTRVPAEGTVRVTDGATLRVHWEDRSMLRTVGWALWTFFQLGGAALTSLPFLVVASQSNPDYGRVFRDEELTGLFFGGVITYAVGWVVGMALAGLRDLATVRVAPGGVAF